MIGRMEFLDGAGLGRNEWWRYLLGLGLIVFATQPGPIQEVHPADHNILFRKNRYPGGRGTRPPG